MTTTRDKDNFAIREFANDFPGIGNLLEMLMGELPAKVPFMDELTPVLGLPVQYFNVTTSAHDKDADIYRQLKDKSPDYMYNSSLNAGLILAEFHQTPEKGKSHIWMESSNGKGQVPLLLHETGRYIDLYNDSHLQALIETQGTHDIVKNPVTGSERKFDETPFHKSERLGCESFLMVPSTRTSANANAMALAICLGIPVDRMFVFLAMDALTDGEAFALLESWARNMSDIFKDVATFKHEYMDGDLLPVSESEHNEENNAFVVSGLAVQLLPDADPLTPHQ